MDWLLVTPQIHSAFSSLGSLEGDTYIISPNALAILEEINYKLTYEDQTLRTFRRAIGFGQNVRSDLIPLLENTKDDDVLDSVIRILVNLTVPVECLFSVDVMYRTEVGRHTIFELNKLLYTSKEAFTDPKSTKSVVEYMKHILESDSKLSIHKCHQINNCLLLLRNILHIPEINSSFILPAVHAPTNGTHAVSMQNAILWNLFIQSIDKLLLYLMTCPQRAIWGVTMVQLIALMYKDQHVSTLQKLLNMWFEASLSESSEDNESNTSPPKQGSGDSSPMLTSDPTSDSSDNGSGGGCKNESSEDRRQALREETEATLQEVSRKGQEYQNSILRAPSEAASELGAEDCEQPCTSAQAAAVAGTSVSSMLAKVEVMDDGEGAVSDFTDAKENKDNGTSTIFKQPAKHIKNTFITYPADSDAANVMPPPAPAARPKPSATSTAQTTVKFSPILLDEERTGLVQHKPCQKAPHSGHLNLIKGKCCPQKRECPSSQSELSDCGYGTQVENQESISTSSNDDDGPQSKPQHQKPPCNSKPRNKQRAVMSIIDKKELRRKKLVKRSKSSLINMKGLVQHTPTDDDISNLLKEFTVDFLLKGYDFLVGELHTQLLTNMKIPIDTSHFFWLVTYFLKFAAQLELDMEHISSILTFDVISYLTYEGVSLCEQLELNSRQEGSDLKPYLRRMHLVVTAIREFLQAIESYKKVTHLSEEDRDHLRRLQNQISTAEDLRCLFVLLLRRFNPSLHTKQYLQDLVVTNHILLLIMDSVTKSEEITNIKMIDHISQFATLEIMNYYGMLLEDFNNNGEFVNDCIFTMMHHVGGDLNQIGTLFQPVILKTFSRIWEADYELCDDWSDLIEYVIHKFINTPQKSQLTLPTTSLTELTKEHNLENTVCTWTQEEMDTLYWYYVQSKKNNDVVGKIVKLFSNNGNKQKSRISIIQQLLQQDIITLVEYDDLMKFEDAEYQRALLTTPTSSSTESGIEMKSSTDFSKPSEDIQILRDLIIKENKEKHLVWLQKLLLECCYIKIILKNSVRREDHQNLEFIMEPVPYHCILKNKSIPVVQWNNEQATTMLYQPFMLLLHKLGFQLPADAGSVFARIPDFWSVDTMFSLAKKLGPLDKLMIKFDTTQFEDPIEVGHCQHGTAARASLSSISSLEMDILEESDDFSITGGEVGGRGRSDSIAEGTRINVLTPVPEVDVKVEKANEIFAVPKAKHCNSIIRFTPDPTSTPSVPNWLQLVMRSKFNNITTITNSATATATISPCDKNDSTNICITRNNNIPSTLMTTTTVTTSSLPTRVAANQIAMTTILHPTTTATTATTITDAKATAAPALMPCQCPSINAIIRLNGNERNNNNINGNCSANSSSSSSNSNINNKSNLILNENNNTTTTTATSTVSTTTASVTTIKGNHHHQQQKQQQSHQQHHNHQHNQQQQQLYHHHQQHQQQQQHHHQNDESALKSFERNEISLRSCINNLDSEYSAMVASVYEHEIANSDSASVASDLTRMYVSDEDEKHEFRVAHFH